MLNHIKAKIGFSIPKQIKFVLALNNEKAKNPYGNPIDWLSNLEIEFSHICKVLLSKLREGCTFREALESILEDLLHPYASGSPENSGINSDLCKVLIAHNQHFTRRVAASLILLCVCLAGIYLGYFQLLLFSGIGLLILSFVSAPIEKLHTIKKLL